MRPIDAIDPDFLKGFLVDLLRIPSPTGFAHQAIQFVEKTLHAMPLPTARTRKGGLVVEWPGEAATAPRGLTAHVDTLGAMVKEIKPNGRLRLARIGGFPWNTVEGEGCLVHTASGKTVRGAILIAEASSHVHGKQVEETRRDDEHMEVRLDERTSAADQTRALGIEVGDFVSFDPRVEVTPAGFIRSRHLDDKASVACLVAAAKALVDAGARPAQRATLHFSNYEEAGHGAASGLPDDLAELVAVDMAAVGQGQASDEFRVTICAKDSGGPYHFDLTHKLRELAESRGIPFVVDTYPYYMSDGEAYWRAGGDVQVALIGPGIDASHNYERTHVEALLATARLIVEYLLS
jgi:putative aminopeptidase FrvX